LNKPKDVSDFEQCKKWTHGMANAILMIYCVECDEWHLAAIRGLAFVVARQGGVKKVEDMDDPRFICLNCGADIDYLLSPREKEILRDSCL
jgi:hypothetical protein